jgi:hypothetical protein
MGALFMKKIFGIKYVPIESEEKDGTFHIKMPFGEMEQYLVKGEDVQSGPM